MVAAKITGPTGAGAPNSRTIPQRPDSDSTLLQAQQDFQNSTGTDRIQSLRTLGKTLVQQQRYQEALVVYEALLAADPLVQNQENAARCLERLGRWSEAIARYNLVLDVDPTRINSLVALGLCLVRVDTPEPALEVFDRCLHLNPSHVGALLGKATCLRLTGNPTGAEKLYRKAIRLQPGIESALDSLIGTSAKPAVVPPSIVSSEVVELERIIASAVSAEDFVTAAQHCEALVKLVPEYYEAWFNLGFFEQRNSNLEAAAEAFLAAARVQPLSVEPMQALGQIYHLLGDLKAAESSYQAALSLAGDSPHLLWNLGLVLEQCGDSQGAAQQFSRLVKSDPDHGEAWFRLGSVRLALNDLEGAVVALRRVRDLGFWTLKSNFNLGVAHWRLGRLDQAEECFHAALQLEQDFKPAKRALAAIALAKHDEPRGRELLRDLLERGDTSLEILFNLAVLDHGADRIHSAIEFYKQALKINPDFADASAGLALAQSTLSARRYN